MSVVNREDLLVVLEISQFLNHEAKLLDEGRLTEWVDLLTEDVVYYSPQTEFVDKPNTALDEIGAHHFNENKVSIQNRIDWLLSGFNSSDLPSAKRLRLISNVQLLEKTGDEFVVESAFLLTQVRWTAATAQFSGRRVDRLRRTGERWQIAARTVYLTNAVLSRSVTTFF